MSVIRQDSASRDWTIFSTERAKRPRDFKRNISSNSKPKSLSSCPFCKGNESSTPEALLEIPSDGNWLVRVVPNKFPAVSPRQTVNSDSQRHIAGPYLYMDGIGSHEVIIESPEHDDDIADMV